MAKISKRRILADNGTTLEFVLVHQDGVVVDDERNSVTMTNADGDELVVPLSTLTATNTARWFDKFDTAA